MQSLSGLLHLAEATPDLGCSVCHGVPLSGVQSLLLAVHLEDRVQAGISVQVVMPACCEAREHK